MIYLIADKNLCLHTPNCSGLFLVLRNTIGRLYLTPLPPFILHKSIGNTIKYFIVLQSHWDLF